MTARLRATPSKSCCPLAHMSPAEGVLLPNVFSYRMCSLTECVVLQNVFSDRLCSLTECVLIQNVFSYRMCSLTECVLLQNVQQARQDGTLYENTFCKRTHSGECKQDGTSTLICHSVREHIL